MNCGQGLSGSNNYTISPQKAQFILDAVYEGNQNRIYRKK